MERWPPMFSEGWTRYWRTFSMPWPTVGGFAVASLVVLVLCELLKYLFLMMVN
jgi:hypothetical protein